MSSNPNRARALAPMLLVCAGCFGPSGNGGAPDAASDPVGGGWGAVDASVDGSQLFVPPELLDGGAARDAGCGEPDCRAIEPAELIALAEVGDARALQLSSTDVYVLVWGSEDAAGVHQGDGHIVRVPRDGGDAALVVDGLTTPQDLLLDETFVLWTERHGDFVQIWVAGRDDGSDRRMLAEGLNLSWTHDGTRVYFMTEEGGTHGAPVELFRVAKAGGVVEQLTHADFTVAGPLAVGADDVYVFDTGGFFAVPREGGEAIKVADGPAANSAFAIYGTHLFYANMSTALRRLRIEDGEDMPLIELGELSEPHRIVPYAAHAYMNRRDPTTLSWVIERAWQDPGAPMAESGTEVMGRRFNEGPQAFVFGVDQGGLFWVDGGVLTHRLLPERDSIDPAQGAVGGPCHPDLTCDSRIVSCVAGLCP